MNETKLCIRESVPFYLNFHNVVILQLIDEILVFLLLLFQLAFKSRFSRLQTLLQNSNIQVLSVPQAEKKNTTSSWTVSPQFHSGVARASPSCSQYQTTWSAGLLLLTSKVPTVWYFPARVTSDGNLQVLGSQNVNPASPRMDFPAFAGIANITARNVPEKGHVFFRQSFRELNG